jgi:hypothetical protein
MPEPMWCISCGAPFKGPNRHLATVDAHLLSHMGIVICHLCDHPFGPIGIVWGSQSSEQVNIFIQLHHASALVASGEPGSKTLRPLGKRHGDCGGQRY